MYSEGDGRGAVTQNGYHGRLLQDLKLSGGVPHYPPHNILLTL